MKPLLLTNALIINEDLRYPADILIDKGRIQKIASLIPSRTEWQVIDVRGKWVIPGMIDDQVHFREPGLTHKGTIASESAAAVMVTGKAERLSTLEVVKYFHSRPRDSQIGAWVSKQSSRISARGILESKFLELKQKFQQGEVPLPSFWGGFRVNIEQMEFWQGGEHRLHDRFLYQRENNAWKIDRLAP